MTMAKHWRLYNPEAIYPESVYYQKALAHFAREYMDFGKVPRMTIRELLPEGNRSKSIRIRSLEPLASSLALHCREDMKDFLTEYSDYSPKNRLCKKDLLDACAYQVQVARPGVPQVLGRNRITQELKETVVCNTDDLLKSFWKVNERKDIFGNNLASDNPFFDEDGEFEGTVDEFISRVPSNPFS